MEPSPIVHPGLLGSLGCIILWAHMSLSCHGPSPLPMGGLWNFIPWMAQVDCRFLLNRLQDGFEGCIRSPHIQGVQVDRELIERDLEFSSRFGLLLRMMSNDADMS